MHARLSDLLCLLLLSAMHQERCPNYIADEILDKRPGTSRKSRLQSVSLHALEYPSLETNSLFRAVTSYFERVPAGTNL